VGPVLYLQESDESQTINRRFYYFHWLPRASIGLGCFMSTAIHNPDQYMAALRTIIAQGRKRIGFLIGAGAPAGMKNDSGARPLIPAASHSDDCLLRLEASDEILHDLTRRLVKLSPLLSLEFADQNSFITSLPNCRR
jgi:hypothetical protein